MKKYFTPFIILLISLLSFDKIHAQNYPQWYCLSHDEIIWDIAFDHNIAWIATRGGLVKFDRVTGSKTYYNAANSTLFDNEVKAVEVDDSGNVWIGMYYVDLVKYDGENWTHYWTLNGTDSLFGINEIKKDRVGNIYISPSGNSGGGIYKFDGANFSTISPSTYFFSFSIDTLNQLWCATYNDLLKYDGTSFVQYDTTSNLFVNASPNTTGIDKNNHVWISLYENTTHEYKLYHFDDTTWTYVPPAISGIPLNAACNISTDDSGNVYFFGYIDGIVKYDGVNFAHYDHATLGIADSIVGTLNIDSAFHFWMMVNTIADTVLYEFNNTNATAHYASNSPLKSAESYHMNIDRDGNRWFCPEFCGLQKFDGYNWTTYNRSNSNINSDKLACVGIDNNNNVWVGSKDSAFIPPIAKFDGTNWTSFQLSFFGNNPYVEKIIPDKTNNIWALVSGSGNGVARFDGVTWNYWDAAAAGFSTFFAFDIAVDTNNNLWAATSDGLAKFSNSVWTKYDKSNSNIPANYVRSVFIDHNNNTWFSTSDSGICKLNDSIFTNYGSYNSIIDGTFFWAMAEDTSNAIWFTSDVGLTKFDGTNWTNYDHYNSGLGMLQIFDIKIDKNNTKWLCPNNGVFLFNENGISPQMWHNVPQTKFEGKIFYDANSDGLCDTITDLGMINQKVICLNDSAVTFSNSQGMYRFYRDSGNYQSSFNPYSNWNITSDSLSYQTSIDTSSVFGLDYGTFPFYPFNQLEIGLTAGTNHCNSQTPFWIEYKNTGTNISDGVITFVKHDSLTFISSNTTPIYMSGDTIMWYYTSLLPYETRSIVLVMQNPSVNSINDTLLSYITVFDAANTTDSAAVTQIISCAYDPNDKSVDPVGFTSQHLTHMGDSLEYTIRFQNLGNDTAYSVYILDSIPATMEKDSFVFIASSHNPDIEISKNGAIRFMFNNIMLPPMSTNEPGSMGYVKYRLKPKPNLPNNTEVRNTAYIYFDFNPAVITNTVSNIYVNTMTGIQEQAYDFALNAYPNPFENLLWIQLMNMVEPKSLVSVYDVTGRKVFEKEFQASLIQLKLNDITPGLYFVSVKNGNALQRLKVVKD